MTSKASSQITIAQPSANLVDPHLTTDRRAHLGIRFAVYDALVRRETDGTFSPSLATNWHVEPDARSWRLDLRPGVKFHNGAPLRAADVVVSLERVMDPNRGGELGTKGVIQSYLEGASFDVVSDNSVQIVTATPMADLLDLLVDLPIVGAEQDGLPIGTGPYQPQSIEAGMVELAAVDHWSGTRRPERLTWLGVPDADVRVEMLRVGQVDLIADPTTTGMAQLATHDQCVLTNAPSGGVTAFLLNASRGPCRDQRVRQAINLALDKGALIRDIVGGENARPINGPLTPLHLAHDPETPPYPYDPDNARALLAEAGYKDDLHLIVDVPTTLPAEASALARAISEQLAAIGVQIEIREHSDRDAYAEMVRAKQIGDACCFDSTPLSSYRVLREKLHSAVRGPWWQGYANPLVDSLLDDAAAKVDLSARQAIYRRAYRHIHQDAPWIFLYEPIHHWASRRGVEWRPAPAGWITICR